MELIERERRTVERRIREARFPAVKSLDSFDFTAIPSLNKMLVLDLARCDYITRRENVIALGNSGTGKTHTALALGLAACQHGFSVGFTTAAGLVSQMMEARDEKRLLKLQSQIQAYKLLIIDELGYVPLSPTGAELLFEAFSQVQTPSILGFGPLKMAAASVACSDPVNHSARRPLGRSNNPSTPSAL
ncbi:hypothetical protein MTBLM5_660006 [Magnetospirillum sp. LM-5]|nr:hypothetical protein MTBLM5_660006 [Magnetospirillum sp. LM-5]